MSSHEKGGKGKRIQQDTRQRDTYTVSRGSEHENLRSISSINSSQNMNKTSKKLHDISGHSPKNKQSVDFVPGTPSTIINISPWGDPTPQPTLSSEEEDIPRHKSATPKPKVTSLKSFKDVREPKVIPKTETLVKARVHKENTNKSENVDIDITNAKNMSSWRDNKSLAECNLYMLTNQIDYDVTLLMGKSQEPILAHSYILLSRSANMESILEGHKDRISKMVAIPEVTADVIKPILQYFYTDYIELTFKLASTIIPATCVVGSRDLMNCCFRYLLSEMSADNVCTILQHAHKVNLKQVYNRCLQFIYANAEEVLHSQSFLKLNPECVDDIVKSDDLNAEELAVYKALLTWADTQNINNDIVSTDETRREALGELLYHVRFKNMDVDEFTQNVSKHEVLQKDEKLVIYQANYNQDIDMPERFEKPPRRIKRQIKRGTDNVGSVNHSKPVTNKNNNRASNHTRYKQLPVEKVIRFDDISGKWQMKGPDAIQLMASSSIILRGAQVYGPVEGLGNFEVEIAVFDVDKLELSKAVMDISPENDKKVYDVLLHDPVKLKANVFYTVQVVINRGPTHYGNKGKKMVETSGLMFEFKNSNRSFNGTDVSMGQIPAILYTASLD